jgi:hypothetical protein
MAQPGLSLEKCDELDRHNKKKCIASPTLRHRSLTCMELGNLQTHYGAQVAQ